MERGRWQRRPVFSGLDPTYLLVAEKTGHIQVGTAVVSGALGWASQEHPRPKASWLPPALGPRCSQCPSFTPTCPPGSSEALQQSSVLQLQSTHPDLDPPPILHPQHEKEEKCSGGDSSCLTGCCTWAGPRSESAALRLALGEGDEPGTGSNCLLGCFLLPSLPGPGGKTYGPLG